jgi:DNA-binding HxlR family transcriptional regulator
MTRQPRSGCPIATTLDIVGDRWTLVILRDLLTGKSRFSHFLASPEKITTNILTDRLDAMLKAGLVSKTAYQQKPMRYEYSLTPKGETLLPVLQQICRWANTHIPGTWIPPESFMSRKAG